jgi:hypothetical protein
MSSLEADKEDVINASSPQHMRSHVVLQRDGSLAGQLDVTTRTWTGILLHGFTGGVYILLREPDGAVIGVSGLHTYGVDGRWIGRADRTEYWSEQFDPGVASMTSSLEIMHTPEDRLPAILSEVEQRAQLAREAYDKLKSQIPPLPDAARLALIAQAGF